jgi:hypothetical protein
MTHWMDPLGNPLRTCPIQMGWEFTMEPYPSGQFQLSDNPDRQFGQGSVWNRTLTRSHGLELLLSLVWEHLELQYSSLGKSTSSFGMLLVHLKIIATTYR